MQIVNRKGTGLASHRYMNARGMTASNQLARHARKIPDSEALSFGDVARTYGELDERVSRLANALRERGVGYGDRVAVLSLNSIEAIETYLATVRLGAIGVPLNFRLVAAEIAYQLTDSGAVAAVVDTTFSEVLTNAQGQALKLKACLVVGGGDGHEAGDDFEHAINSASPDCEELDVDEREPAYIMYTSGTTGRPKGAVLTHYNLMLHAFSSSVHLGVRSDDRVSLSGAPLFHIAGLCAYLMCLLPGGKFVVMPSGGFDPAETVSLLERERVSFCFFVPSQWAAICAVPEIGDHDLSALRRISWGAAPASTALLRTMIETFPQAEVVTAFGQTECSPVTCYLRGEDSIRKIGSIGTPMLNVEVRV
ncbi:MAG: fatty-acyl-CoA synthase, partial [Pseudonocardiales bacterium]|nr:fatty-acyl-CoA synthase [Pseudonocardiales bacterium]